MKSEPPIPVFLGERYEHIAEIGRGGMGTVFQARDRVIEQVVAIKVIEITAHNQQYVARLQREAQTLSSITHPNIVKVFRLEYLASFVLLVMEYLPGKDLNQVVASEGPLLPERCRQIFIQALSGISAIHERGIVHRDIKPSNIMLVKDASGAETLKLLDFGIAKRSDEAEDQRLTKPGAVLGTPLFMSPEQCSQQPLDRRSDLYSLGWVLYFAATGKPPFESETNLGVMLQHLNTKADRLTGESAEARHLNEVFQQAVKKNPDQRFQTAEEFSAALKTPTFRCVGKQEKSRLQKKLPSAKVLAIAAGFSGFIFVAASLWKIAPDKPETITATTSTNSISGKPAKIATTPADQAVIRAFQEAQIYEKAQKFPEAEECFKRAISTAESRPKAAQNSKELTLLHQRLAILYASNDKRAEAILEYEEALRVANRTADINNVPIRLGQLYVEDKRPTQFITEFYRNLLESNRYNLKGKVAARVKAALLSIPGGARSKEEEYRYLSEALLEREHIQNDVKVGNLATRLAALQFERGEYAASEETLKQTLPWMSYQIRQNKRDHIAHVQRILEAQLRQGHKPDVALVKQLEGDTSTFTDLHDWLVQASLYETMARYYESTKQPNNARSELKKSVACIRKVGTAEAVREKEFIFNLHWHYLNALLAADLKREAAREYESCIENALHNPKIDPEAWPQNMQWRLSLLLKSIGRRDQALKSMQETRILAEKAGDKLVAANASNWLALELLRDQTKTGESIKMLEGACNSRGDNYPVILKSILDYATAAHEKGNITAFEQSSRMGAQLAKEKHLPDYEMRLLSPLAVAAVRKKDNATAQPLLHRIVDIAKANHITTSMQQMGASWHIALYESQQHNHQAVVDATNDCIDTMSQTLQKDSIGHMDMFRKRAEAQSQLGHWEQAYGDFKRALEIAMACKKHVDAVYSEQKAFLERTNKPTELRELEAKMASYRSSL